METFDLVHTPLAGTNLIESSAGTGKTYTIAGLFLRMILEKHISADRILVVTFTKAATQELKSRIRNTLLKAKTAFSKGSSGDFLIDALVKKHDNPTLAIQLIRDALIDFDTAAIFTIHGFCQRILQENAFETGSLFDTELTADQVQLTQGVADDFWRKRFYNSPPEFISYFLKKISGPEYFAQLLSKAQTPEIKIIPEISEPALDSLDDYRKNFNRLKTAWPLSRTRVEKLLKQLSLSGTVYGSVRATDPGTGVSKRDLRVSSMLDAMDRFVDPKSVGFPLFKNFEKFTAKKLEKSTRKNQLPPSHEIFDLCDRLYTTGSFLEAEMEKYLLFLKTLFFKFAATELQKRKKISNIQFFDDLLTMVKDALSDRGGNALANTIRNNFQAALVDEFQDTDPVQYEIFSRLFSSEESVLFMIGDPKQAIYSFRGADIFSYLKAAADTDSKYTLNENWRTEPGLIKAVNTLFSNARNSFVFDEIVFEKAASGVTIGSSADSFSAPLELWYLESKQLSGSGKPINKTEAIQWIAKAVAGEISRIVSAPPDSLSSGGSGHVDAGDIAVLVRTNRQARIIKSFLSAKQIPSVLYYSGNIFDSHEALEMERILSGISEPGNERFLKAALVTDMLGVSGEKLDLESVESIWWENRLASFRRYFRLWNRYGFITMFRMFMADENVKARLLAFQDGERRITNILHLSEILHQVSIEKKPGMTGLLKWLAEQRDFSSPMLEANQLRLESDERGVKIITIHKSKGLEFPVVFCPFGWEGSLIKEEGITFHESDGNRLPVLDLGSKNPLNLTLAHNELLAENLRLLYVALTRAKTRCYLVWGRINTAETSALAYLFHHEPAHEDSGKRDDIVASLKDIFTIKSDADMLDDLKRFEGKSGNTIKLLPLPLEDKMAAAPPEEKKENLSYRQFSGNIDTTWKISSYSSLMSQQKTGEAQPDRDAYWRMPNPLVEYPGQPDLSTKKDIFSFPKGPKAGTFFHDVFEHLDFASADFYQFYQFHQFYRKENLVEAKLNEYGFDVSYSNLQVMA